MAVKPDFNAIEVWVAQHARMFVLLMMSLVVFVGTVALIVFFIALRGGEQALVPDLRNRELADALLELQEKELYPRIQLRLSDSAQERGLVLEQDPRPGTIVKAGRRIRLVVSQGIQIDVIEDYRGRNFEEVQADLRALFPPPSPLVSAKNPPMYQYSSEPEGTVLQQKPVPGTPVSGPVILEFVVSRGSERVLVEAPALTGLSPGAALERLRGTGLRFRFSLRPARQGERGGVVLSQEPEAGVSLEQAQTVTLLVSEPARPANGNVFLLYEYAMPENPLPLPVKLEYLPAGGMDRVSVVETDFQGGIFSFPCQAPPGSTLIFSVMDRELNRTLVQPRVDELSLDEIQG